MILHCQELLVDPWPLEDHVEAESVAIIIIRTGMTIIAIATIIIIIPIVTLTWYH